MPAVADIYLDRAAVEAQKEDVTFKIGNILEDEKETEKFKAGIQNILQK